MSNAEDKLIAAALSMADRVGLGDDWPPFEDVHAWALNVTCRLCGALIGQECVGPRPHPSRIREIEPIIRRERVRAAEVNLQTLRAARDPRNAG
jgi:hypothetical protein